MGDNTAESKQHCERVVLGILVIALLGTVAGQFRPNSSHAILQTKSHDSDFTEMSPRIDANYTSLERQAQAPIETLAKHKQQTKLSQLNAQVEAGKARLDEDLQHQLQALNNRYKIQYNAFNARLKTQRDPQRREAIQQQAQQMYATFLGRAQAAKDKAVQAQTGLQRAFEEQKRKLK